MTDQSGEVGTLSRVPGEVRTLSRVPGEVRTLSRVPDEVKTLNRVPTLPTLPATAPTPPPWTAAAGVGRGSPLAVAADQHALDADEAAAHEQGDEQQQGQHAVADDELPEGEAEHRLVAPVARLVQGGHEVRLPDVEEPVVAEGEPDAEEDVEGDVGHAGHGQQVDVVVQVAQVLLVPLHLLPQQEEQLDDAEAASHHQVDGQLGLHGTLVKVVDTCGNMGQVGLSMCVSVR